MAANLGSNRLVLRWPNPIDDMALRQLCHRYHVRRDLGLSIHGNHWMLEKHCSDIG
jgi:hypothetical protein